MNEGHFEDLLPFLGAIASIWKYSFSPGIGLWILNMLTCFSTKRYALEHNLMATELKM